MSMPQKERVKVAQLVERIQAGAFDANDVDNLLIKLRPYASNRPTFLEVAHFVAHPDARTKGIAHSRFTYFFDAITNEMEKMRSGKTSMDLSKPFPPYLYRLFITQTEYCDEKEFRDRIGISKKTFAQKLQSNFTKAPDKVNYVLKAGKGGMQFFHALHHVMSFIEIRPAFSIHDFFGELTLILGDQKFRLDDMAWRGNSTKVCLAVLCLIAETNFEWENGGKASCSLRGERDHCIRREGHQDLLDSDHTAPNDLGNLQIFGEVMNVHPMSSAPITYQFPIITSEISVLDHCDESFFTKRRVEGDSHSTTYIEVKFPPSISLSKEFKLIATPLNA